MYLGTNEKVFEFEKVKQIFSHRQTTWSDELKIILDQIPETHVLIILEDYFIYEPVKTSDISKCLEVMTSNDAAFLKLGAFPSKYDTLWPSKKLDDFPGFGEIQKGSEYRLSLQTAIWKKKSLLKLLNPTENPWQFEIEASKRSNLMDEPFLCVLADPSKKMVHGPITYYCTALSAGKWMRGAVQLCKKEKIAIDLSIRKVESVFEEYTRAFYIALPLPLRKVFDFLKHKTKFN